MCGGLLLFILKGSTMGEFLFAAVVFYIGYLVYQGFQKEYQADEEKRLRPDRPEMGRTTRRVTPAVTQQITPVFAWPERGEYDFEVVGESYYQPALEALPDTFEDGQTGIAVLVPEDDNPHDPKAVRVTVQGRTIGHLSREDARSYRRRLAGKKLGMVPASCGVMITGGYPLSDGTHAFYGAMLDIKPFE